MTEGLCPQKMAWELLYSDGSGVQYAVRYNEINISDEGNARIEFENVNTVYFPVSRLDWLIACLTKIRGELQEEEKTYENIR